MHVNPTPDMSPDDAMLLNKNGVPLREIPVHVFADDGTKTTMSVNYPISGDLSTPCATTRGLVLSGEPNPITFGDWRMAKATGTIKVKVKRDKITSKVVLEFSELIPNPFSVTPTYYFDMQIKKYIQLFIVLAFYY